jgi:hypothetical protein
MQLNVREDKARQRQGKGSKEEKTHTATHLCQALNRVGLKFLLECRLIAFLAVSHQHKITARQDKITTTTRQDNDNNNKKRQDNHKDKTTTNKDSHKTRQETHKARHDTTRHDTTRHITRHNDTPNPTTK